MLENLPFEILEIVNHSLHFKDKINLMKCSKSLYSCTQKLLFHSHFLVFTNLNTEIKSKEEINNLSSEFCKTTEFHNDLNLIVINDINHLFSIFNILCFNPLLINYIKSFKVHLVDLSNHNTKVQFQKSIGFTSTYDNKENLNLSFDVSHHSFQILNRNIKKLCSFTLDTLVQDHRDKHILRHPKLHTEVNSKLRNKNINATFEKRRKSVKSHEDFQTKSDSDTIILNLENSLKRHFIFMPDDKTFPINTEKSIRYMNYIKNEMLCLFIKIFKYKVLNRPYNISNNWSFELIALNNAQIQSNFGNNYYHSDHDFIEGESRDLSQLSIKNFGLDISKLKKEIELISSKQFSCHEMANFPVSFLILGLN